MPILVVVRHAKADSPSGLPDVDRPLRPRGRDDAAVAGSWLRSTVGRLDAVVSSPARRAAETTTALLTAYGDVAPDVIWQPSLYEASRATALAVVRDLGAADGLRPDAAAAVVGHNPSLSGLVGLLTGTPTELRTAASRCSGCPERGRRSPPEAAT